MDTAITGHYKAQPVDRTDPRFDPVEMRKKVFIFAIFSPGMRVTLDEVSEGLKYSRFQAKARLMELVHRGYVRILPETVNRRMVYEVCIKKENQ